MRAEPTATDWITAVSTAGAFVAAVAAAVIAGIVVRHDRAARRAEQANRVAAWVERRQPQGPRTGLTPSWYACVLHNTSSLPVYDIVLSFQLYDDDGQKLDRPTDRLYLLPPGERDHRIPDRITGAASSLMADMDKTRVQISFTDAAGRKWRRNHEGHLAERRPPARPSLRPEELVARVARCRPRA